MLSKPTISRYKPLKVSLCNQQALGSICSSSLELSLTIRTKIGFSRPLSRFTALFSKSHLLTSACSTSGARKTLKLGQED